nr:M6 family metalloprotease domain-containing protein [candidate division Zixibacteria bacterium]
MMKNLMAILTRQIIRKLAIYILTGLLSTAWAMPPNPVTLEQHLRAGKALPYYLDQRPMLLSRGIGAASKKLIPTSKASISGQFRALAILIQFSDKTASVAAENFDTLLFVDKANTVRNYYYTVSYGQLDIVTVNLPSSLNWISAPQTYAYYCNSQNGTGAYPQNTQKLCEDMVTLVDPWVDFSQYDNDDDGEVDALILIHTGPGAEYTHQNSDIWSHKWSTMMSVYKDGVRIRDYDIQPEYWLVPGDMTCGVYCHELGHIFGLPDLYDTDYSSRGIGRWSVMSYGSWNGPSGLGACPAELDAWSRIELGFKEHINVISNTSNVLIDNVEDGGNIYRLWNNGTIGNEYYLVENRQKVGYDTYLPGAGLLIWHIDENLLGSMAPNDNEWYPGHTSGGHFGVALEQGDGLFQLEKLLSSGDWGDPFPGNSGNTAFTAFSSPSSNSYADVMTSVSVSDISDASLTMTADFQISYTSDVNNPESNLMPNCLILDQNYPNPFNPSTRIRFELPAPSRLTLSVYNILGRKVVELAGGNYPAGSTEIIWEGFDASGQPVSSGIYFYEIVTDYTRQVRKMILVK